MISLSKIKSVVVTSGKRVLKVLQFGVKTADEVSPYGDDSSPLNGMTAIYASTSEAGEQVIVGYINTNQVAKQGEKRMYSQESNGSISFYIYLKNDGTCEIGGDNDNAIRYEALNTEIQKQVSDINIELGKIATAIGSIGGTYVVAPIVVDLNSSKIEEIKVP